MANERVERNIDWCNSGTQFDWDLFDELCDIANYNDEQE